MSPRRRASRRSTVHRNWWTVRSGVACAMGHFIGIGETALFTQAGWKRTILCQVHAKEQLNLEPPPRPFTFRTEHAEDFKDRQTGGDE